LNKPGAGRDGENRAAAFLERAGMRILVRNFRSSFGEVDLVALDRETVVFVEVKNWSVYTFDSLSYGINPKKQRRIIETAKYFLSVNRKYNGMAVRFDVVFINSDNITHLVAAFMECI
jgi:putative endonuclease